MSEFLHKVAADGMWMPSTFLMFTGLAVMTAWALHYYTKAQKALPEGCIALDAEMHKRNELEMIELRAKCLELKQEVDDLKSAPKPDRLTPVIDWIDMCAIYTDYDAELHELEIGWLDGSKNMGHSTLCDISEAQARELNEEFKLCIKAKHQPARFA